jgi:hypothetical protein
MLTICAHACTAAACWLAHGGRLQPTVCSSAGLRTVSHGSVMSGVSEAGNDDWNQCHGRAHLVKDAGAAVGYQQVLQQGGLAHAALADDQDLHVLLAGPRWNLHACHKHNGSWRQGGAVSHVCSSTGRMTLAHDVPAELSWPRAQAPLHDLLSPCILRTSNSTLCDHHCSDCMPAAVAQTGAGLVRPGFISEHAWPLQPFIHD